MKKRILEIGLLSCFALTACDFAPLEIQSCTPIYAMDTTISITFYNVKDYKTYYQDIKSIYKDVSSVSDDFKTGGSTVSVYDLNEAREADVSDTLKDLLECALTLKEETSGYFNPYIGRLSHLWKTAMDNNATVDSQTITSELGIMADTYLTLEGNHAKITGEGNLDLGAMAKGYATEKAYEYLEEKGITSYLIDAGNSSIVLGDKHGKDLSAGIVNPYSSGEYIGILKTQHQILSTSSPMYQYIEIEGRKYHHLLNPMTGYPSDVYDSVSVINHDAMRGDAYSTAIFSMPLEEAIAFGESKGISLILFKDDEIIYQSEEVTLS